MAEALYSLQDLRLSLPDLARKPLIGAPPRIDILKGITLDFQDGLKGKGFVFRNPNATSTCGCGESFSV